jgi:predicted MPP superfamily phosphohydrolase
MNDTSRLWRPLLVAITLTVMLTVMFGVPWYTLFLAGTRWPALVVILGTAVFAASMLAFLPLMYYGHRRHRDGPARIGDAILGAVWVLFVWAVLANLLRVALLLGGVGEPFRSRVVAVAVVIVTVLLMLYGYFEAMRVPRVKHISVPLARLPAAFDGLRVVQLSDIHFGPIERTQWTARVVAAVNALDADIVCITGDLADGTVSQRREQAASLGHMQARLARVYAPGNHEHYGEAAAWLDHMRDLGWAPLCNRRIVVQRDGAELVVAGIEDASAAGNADVAATLAGVGEERPVLLLAHQPKQVGEAAACGIDLQLAGHTHGGQIWPFGLLVRLAQPALHGLSRHGRRTWLYTSRGTGFWGPPLRIFAPGEITLMTLAASTTKARQHKSPRMNTDKRRLS